VKVVQFRRKRVSIISRLERLVATHDMRGISARVRMSADAPALIVNLPAERIVVELPVDLDDLDDLDAFYEGTYPERSRP
jgi:hypothetical protein